MSICLSVSKVIVVCSISDSMEGWICWGGLSVLMRLSGAHWTPIKSSRALQWMQICNILTSHASSHRCCEITVFWEWINSLWSYFRTDIKIGESSTFFTEKMYIRGLCEIVSIKQNFETKSSNEMKHRASVRSSSSL